MMAPPLPRIAPMSFLGTRSFALQDLGISYGLQGRTIITIECT